MSNSGALSTRKTRALQALLTCKNVTEAGELSGVPTRTLYRWLQEADFQSALSNAEGEVLDNAIRRLTALSDAAVGVLADSLQEGVADYVRLKAAGSVLDYVLRLREMRNLEKRLQTLEELLNG